MKRAALRLFVIIPHIKLFSFNSHKVKQFTMSLLSKIKGKLKSNSSPKKPSEYKENNKKVDYNRKPTKIEQLSFKLKRFFDVIKHKIKTKPIDPDSSGRTESITAEEETSLDYKSPVPSEEGKKRLGGTDAEKKNKKSKSKSTSQSHKDQAEDGIIKKRKNPKSKSVSKRVSKSKAIDVEQGQYEQDKSFFDSISFTELDEFSTSCGTIGTNDIYLSSEEEKKSLKQTNENDAKKKKTKSKSVSKLKDGLVTKDNQEKSVSNKKKKSKNSTKNSSKKNNSKTEKQDHYYLYNEFSLEADDNTISSESLYLSEDEEKKNNSKILNKKPENKESEKKEEHKDSTKKKRKKLKSGKEKKCTENNTKGYGENKKAKRSKRKKGSKRSNRDSREKDSEFGITEISFAVNEGDDISLLCDLPIVSYNLNIDTKPCKEINVANENSIITKPKVVRFADTVVEHKYSSLKPIRPKVVSFADTLVEYNYSSLKPIRPKVVRFADKVVDCSSLKSVSPKVVRFADTVVEYSSISLSAKNA